MGDFTYLITGTLYFLCKFIAMGVLSTVAVLLGIAYRKKKDAKQKNA